MTDKQIIIDGVDVSGCACYVNTGECTNENVYPDYCKACSNCTYKLEQLLQVKEQECDALQKSENEAGEIIAELQAYKDVNEDFKTAWKELKAENEELKKTINEAKNSKLDLKSFRACEAVQNEYEQQLDQLKQTLDEIEEFCIVYSDNHDAYENVYKHILEIINEERTVNNDR